MRIDFSYLAEVFPKIREFEQKAEELMNYFHLPTEFCGDKRFMEFLEKFKRFTQWSAAKLRYKENRGIMKFIKH